MHHAKRPDQRHRNRETRNERRARATQKQKHHEHHESGRDEERALGFPERRPDARRTIHHHCEVGIGRQQRAQARQLGVDRIDGRDDIGARLPADHEQHGGTVVMKTVTVAVLHRIGDFRDITQPHRSTVAITDDHGQIFLRAPQLIADLHLPLAPACLHAATRTDRIGIGDRPAHFVEGDPVMRQRVRVQLDTHCRQRAPSDRHLTDPLNLGNFLREDRGRNIVERTGSQIRRT